MLKRFLKKAVICIVLTTIATEGIIAQTNSPYDVSVKKDLPLLMATTAFYGSTLVWRKQTAEPTATDFKELDKNDIWKLDRFATENWSIAVSYTHLRAHET